MNPATLPVFKGRPLAGGPGIRIFVSEATSLLSPVTGSTASKTFTDAGQTLFIQLTAGLFLAAGLIGLIARRTWATVLGLCTVVALIVVGVGIGFLIYLSYKEDPGVESRYALSAAPILALCIGTARRAAPAGRGRRRGPRHDGVDPLCVHHLLSGGRSTHRRAAATGRGRGGDGFTVGGRTASTPGHARGPGYSEIPPTRHLGCS